MAAARATISYSTSFDEPESALSEGGIWTHAGVHWTPVATAGGVAFGTQSGAARYDDSYAYLSGFPPNQTARAIVHRDASLVGDTTHEVELLLRWSGADHDARGYECNFAYDGSYAGIVRWNGPKDSFKFLDPPSGTGHIPGGLHEGDEVSARAVGNVISSYVNGTLVMQVVDDRFRDGNPGIGFFRGGPSPKLSDLGFSSFSATALPDGAPVLAPGARLPREAFGWPPLLIVLLCGAAAALFALARLRPSLAAFRRFQPAGGGAKDEGARRDRVARGAP